MAGIPDQERLDQLAARIREADNRKSNKTRRIAFDFAATVIACTLFGLGADWQLGTKPWGFWVMCAAGFAAGFVKIWRGLNHNSPTPGP